MENFIFCAVRVIKLKMTTLLFGKVFSINFFKLSNLPSTALDDSLTLLLTPTCNIRGGSRAAATSKMECFVIKVNYYYKHYYHKAHHLGCCSSPKSASEYCIIRIFFSHWLDIIIHAIDRSSWKVFNFNLSIFFEILSSMPDNIESPTMTELSLLHFWRFSFELGDIRGFLICLNFSCCFWRNWINWFSIVIIDLFSLSRCCCVSSFWSPSFWVWLSVISFLSLVLFSTVKLFLFCLWKCRSPAVALIWPDWTFVVS